MQIFVTGASGFVGHALVNALLDQHHTVHALVTDKPLDRPDTVRSFTGGLFDSTALHHAMTGCDAAIHLVGIIKETRTKKFEKIHVQGTQNVLEAAKRLNIKRYLHMSALGARPGSPSQYHQTKFQAEALVGQSGLDYTIFRPSVIHGPKGEFMQMEAAWARKRKAPFLFMPYVATGVLGRKTAGKLQPIYVNDVARAFVDALTNTKTIEQSYDLGGDQIVTWPQMHQIAADILVHHSRWTLPVPAWYAKILAKVLPNALTPITRDQIVMALEDNVADLSHFQADFGWTPAPFNLSLQTYASQI